MAVAVVLVVVLVSFLVSVVEGCQVDSVVRKEDREEELEMRTPSRVQLTVPLREYLPR